MVDNELVVARRHCHLMLVLATLSLVVTLVVGFSGVDGDALLVVPVLLLLLPLLGGRYLGEEQIARLVARVAARRRRPVRASTPPPASARLLRRVLPRGGRLVAVAMARRGPPRGILATSETDH